MSTRTKSQQIAETMEIVDVDKVGRKGMPRHYQAFGIEPPMKTVPINDDGSPNILHPGLDID